MFQNVIVGVDGGEGGRDAIALARLLVSAEGRLTLAYIYHGDPHVWRGSSPPYEAAEIERTRALLNAARDEAEVVAELRWAGSSKPGRGLHELAQESGADLLVLGSSRRGLFGRVLTGDDTRAALNGAPCAVAIAPAGYRLNLDPLRTIGVGYDDSPESRHALQVGRELAEALEGRLSAFEAVALPSYAFGGGMVVLADVVDDLAAEARDRLAQLDGVEPHAGYGKPGEELARYSASVDLLVVGSRGYGPLGRIVHGSTSAHLARASRCPLLVLPRAAREATSGSAEHEHVDRRDVAVSNG